MHAFHVTFSDFEGKKDAEIWHPGLYMVGGIDHSRLYIFSEIMVIIMTRSAPVGGLETPEGYHSKVGVAGLPVWLIVTKWLYRTPSNAIHIYRQRGQWVWRITLTTDRFQYSGECMGYEGDMKKRNSEKIFQLMYPRVRLHNVL